MRTHCVVVLDVLPQHPKQVSLTKNDHVVQAFAPQGAHDTFADRIRIGCRHRNEDCLYADSCCLLNEVAPVAAIPVANQVSGLGPHGVASISWRQTHEAVGFLVTLT